MGGSLPIIMTPHGVSPQALTQPEEELSIFGAVNALLRWRRLIIGLGVGGALLFGVLALLSGKVFKSSATFVPQSPEAQQSSFAMAAASQFGFRVPTGGLAWGPSTYIRLLKSRAFLDPIARDTVTVAEENGRRAAVLDLLNVTAPTPERRLEAGIRTLSNLIVAEEDRSLGAVELSVTTAWPSVSLALVEKVLQRVNEFNLQTRRSQASPERAFAAARAAEAESSLRAAEDRLQALIQRNRSMEGSPELQFQRERLNREIALRQALYTTWMQSLEEARIREVRDTPVITVLEPARLPAVREARRTVQKAVWGGLLGGALGVLLAFLFQAVSKARGAPDERSQEFFQLIDEVTPRFMRRRRA